MKYYFKVANIVCCINNNVSELDERIKRISTCFSETNESEERFILTIHDESFVMSLDKKKYSYDIKITVRDLYQLFYAFVSMVVKIVDGQFLIHSAIVSKGDEAILIAGDYSSGKTTLANVFAEYGYEVNSADRSVCLLTDGKLYTIHGTKKVVSDSDVSYLTEENTTKNIQISKVLFLEGISHNGDLRYTEMQDKIRIKKKLFYSVTNIFLSPFEESNTLLCDMVDDYYFDICKDIANLDIDFIALRGDVIKIVKKIDGIDD